MDETRELLRAIMGRVQELGAQMKGVSDRLDHLDAKVDGLTVRVDGLSVKVDGLATEVRELRGEVGMRFDHLASRWMDHDQEICLLKRKQA